MSDETRHFELSMFTQDSAQVFFSFATWNTAAAQVIKGFDEFFIRVVGDVAGLRRSKERVRRIMSDCSGLVALLPCYPSDCCTTDPRVLEDLRIGAELAIPLLIFKAEGVVLDIADRDGVVAMRFGISEPIRIAVERVYGPVTFDSETGPLAFNCTQAFTAEILKPNDRIRSYGFFVGRLERDFAQARDAIRVAVETEAGIPFLWADDGRHRTNVESVRERTRLLLRYASFVIADLTLGVESPEHENPSRAHEIGMSIAYDKKLLLLSQEPRRSPYYSVSDLQVVFWSTEAELECKVKEWIRNHGDCVGRVVWNHWLREVGYQPRITAPQFRFDANRRYIGPKTSKSNGRGFLYIALVLSVATLLLFALLSMVVS